MSSSTIWRPMFGRCLSLTLLLFLRMTATSHAFHLFRGDENGGCGSGCCPASGELTDDPVVNGIPIHGAITAEVAMLDNTFNDSATGLPVTHIKAGEAVRWSWNSANCHSVDGRGANPMFYSGFHYPTEPPKAPEVLPGLIDYPIPDPTPTLTYVHTFDTQGMFLYMCEHHFEIGMIGLVIVDP